MSRSLEIPSVVGINDITDRVNHVDSLIIDGLSCDVIINSTDDDVQAYEKKQKNFLAEKEELAKLVNDESVSKEGVHVELAANIGTPNDLEGVKNNGAEGFGLYRTEFLYMGRDNMPSEEEQFEA